MSALAKNLEEAKKVPGSIFGKHAMAVLEKAYVEARMQNSYLEGRLDQAAKAGDKVVVVIDDDEEEEGNTGARDGNVRQPASGPSKRKSLPAGELISITHLPQTSRKQSLKSFSLSLPSCSTRSAGWAQHQAAQNRKTRQVSTALFPSDLCASP